MKIGIDKIAFYIPNQYLELSALAKERLIDPDKFAKGLLQEQMRLAPLWHDCVSLGANAAYQIIDNDDILAIDLIIVATESAVDQSKAAALFIHKLLGLRSDARAIEVKQACYGATFALQTAVNHVKLNPESKVLVIAADIAKYQLYSSGEATQGAGAVAMLISTNPKVLEYDNQVSYKSEEGYDFWRPNYLEYALVDGHFSNQNYQAFFLEVYQNYLAKYQLSLNDFSAICFHHPYGKLALNSLKLIADSKDNSNLFDNLAKASLYNKKIGNIYNGSLYLSLISLLENATLKANDKIGLFSYGSGAVGEFFSLTVVAGYQNNLYKKYHTNLIDNGISLTTAQYEMLANQNTSNQENVEFEIIDDNSMFYLKEIKGHKRIYQHRK